MTFHRRFFPSRSCLFGLLLACGTTRLVSADTVDEVLAQLGQPDLAESARLAAIDEAVKLDDPRLVPGLIPFLSSESTAIRFEAATALGRMGPDAAKAIPGLTKRLSDASPVVQHAVIDALRQIGPEAKSSTSAIRSAMETCQPVVEMAALRALYRLGDRDDEIISRLVDGLNASRPATRSEASWALQDIGPVALPAIAAKLTSLSPEGQMAALDVIIQFGPLGHHKSIDFAALLSSANPMVVRRAAIALEQLRTCDDASRERLLALAGKADVLVRAAAIAALGTCEPDEKILAALGSALEDKDPSIRLAAVAALAEGKNHSPAVLTELADCLDDSDGAVAVNAAHALMQIGEPAVPAVVPLLKSKDYQLLALGILEGMGPAAQKALPEVQPLLTSSDDAAARLACLIVAHCGVAAENAIPELAKVLAMKSHKGRAAAAYALGTIGTAKALAEAAGYRKDDDQLVRIAVAAGELQAKPDDKQIRQEALPLLREALKRPEPHVRTMACEAIGLFGPSAAAALPELTELVKKRAEAPMEAEAALRAIAMLGPVAATAVPLLTEAVSEDGAPWQMSAGVALGRIGEQARPAVPALQRLIASERPAPRTVAAWALLEIAPTKEQIKVSTPLLLEALVASRERAVVELIQSLDRHAGDRPDVREAIQALKDDERPAVRAAVAEALK